MSKCSADETPVCCCMDVGTIMDNSDCTASYSRVFANRAEAEQTLAALTEKARSVESEPCKITFPFLHLAKCKKMVKTMIRSDHFIYFFTGECYGSGFTAGYPPGRSYRHC